MKHDLDNHRRRSIRLKDYDYSQEGAYFVTLCAYNRECLFGEVVGEAIQLNTCGCIVDEEWLRTQIVRPNVTLDEFVIMPNHIHVIFFLTDYSGDDVGATWQVAPTKIHVDPGEPSLPKGPTAGSVGAIIGQFKRITTIKINKLRGVESSTPVWQRNYYETIIRNEQMLNTKRQYIANNPARWAFDEDNPVNIRKGR